MLKTLKDLFDRLVLPHAGLAPPNDEHALHLAAAVLLVEVMRADTDMRPSERQAVHAALREKFGLAADEAEALGDLAVTTARSATDLFAFTSRIDERFPMERKVRLIELMWQVAYADGHLADHERHTLWRAADLLHVPQGAYVLARQRARDAAGAAGEGAAQKG
jgi:uncharacterized tellurite resistance protein B-like protein